MLRKITLVLIRLILTFGCAYADSSSLPSQAPIISDIEPIQKKDRILILAPHPDDETIGCAGIIQEALRQGAKVQVVYFTNGDSNQLAFIVYEKRLTFKKGEFIHMGEVRRKESISAMRVLGLNESNLTFLGYPDFGTFMIFMSHWRDEPAFRSLLTKASSVPYKENFSYGRPYKGESVLEDLKSIIKKYKPNKIFVSHPADTNGDHRALYLFLQIALSDLNKELVWPKIYPYLIHCIGWPLPRHYHPELSLSAPKKFTDSVIKWSRYLLSPQQLDEKYKAILVYKSQTESSAFYLLSFGRKNELFGDYSEIELNLSTSTAKAAVKNQFDSFFNVSGLYKNADLESGTDLENTVEDQGHVSYGLSEDSLLIRITKTRELNRRFGVLLYLFGYSWKTPFGKMPKLRIIAQHNRFKVFNGKKMIKAEGISLELNAQEFSLKVPLKILGEPDFILSSMKTYTGILPVDTVSFRKINIRR
jgi:LmbE family N-acetylglucosaminyl deacetylase